MWENGLHERGAHTFLSSTQHAGVFDSPGSMISSITKEDGALERLVICNYFTYHIA